MPPGQIGSVAEGHGFERACMMSRARAEGDQSVREKPLVCRRGSRPGAEMVRRERT